MDINPSLSMLDPFGKAPGEADVNQGGREVSEHTEGLEISDLEG